MFYKYIYIDSPEVFCILLYFFSRDSINKTLKILNKHIFLTVQCHNLVTIHPNDVDNNKLNNYQNQRLNITLRILNKRIIYRRLRWLIESN